VALAAPTTLSLTLHDAKATNPMTRAGLSSKTHVTLNN
jgi:hypothetical protein